MPDGSASPRASTRSTADSEPSEDATLRATLTACSGSLSAFSANSALLSRSSISRPIGGSADGNWSLTVRIICSGVTPLATSEAISEPALVPT